MQLSSQQVGFLLSSIWNQAISEENRPANYEAIAHTFNLALRVPKFEVISFYNKLGIIPCFPTNIKVLTVTCKKSIIPPENGYSITSPS